MSNSTIKTVAFFGASTGVGLAALKSTLAAGHRCVALCRTPSTLTNILSPSEYPNLTVVAGNAHDGEVVSRCITKENGDFVDTVVTTIGSKVSGLTIEDSQVCRKGMATLHEAITELRRKGAGGRPHIIACSSTGISRAGRDVPYLMVPLYHVLLKVPHEDKLGMEIALEKGGEDFTVIRCSLLMGGESETKIRVGIEDPVKGKESDAIGYTISREDAGRWCAEHLILGDKTAYLNKYATITY